MKGRDRALAGVDGCRAGWVAAVRLPGAAPDCHVVSRFADLLAALPDDAVIAVDMPIGLPERIGIAGRPSEGPARRMLAKRRSSIFLIPARAAVERGAGPFASGEARRAAYREALVLARAACERGAGFSIQAFGIFPKIVELDRLLRSDPRLADRVIESHPELAFAVLNEGREMPHPKTVPEGLAERQAFLAGRGFDPDFLDRPLPGGVKRDDRLDACILLLVAERFARNEAVAFPDPPACDGHGLPIAIRA